MFLSILVALLDQKLLRYFMKKFPNVNTQSAIVVNYIEIFTQSIYFNLWRSNTNIKRTELNNMKSVS